MSEHSGDYQPPVLNDKCECVDGRIGLCAFCMEHIGDPSPPPYSQPTAPVEDIDPTLVWLLRRMMDEWGAAGVKDAVDAIHAAQFGRNNPPDGHA